MTDKPAEQEILYFNGVDGATGEYGLPPMTGAELAGFIQGESPPENLDELKFRYQQSTQATFGVKEGVDPKALDQAGWGIIFASDANPAVKEALQPLIDLRSSQAGGFFKLYEGSDGYRLGESKNSFLARHGAGPGPADPEKVPYYLMIVGSPAQISYQFQSQLDVQYAVGRIHFNTIAEYGQYARSVIEAEAGRIKLPRRAAFFSVGNPGDRATQLSTQLLIEPLHRKLSSQLKDWKFEAFLLEQATKAQLARLLGGDQTPALLFTGSHGMSFPMGDARQLPHQGALLCQDWPGPAGWREKGPVSQDFYFAGDDLVEHARLLGLIAFFFACYGAGTPQYDEFSRQAFKERKAIADAPFVAQLPSSLLSHPHGGALAVIGHVERAWGYSFLWPKAGAQTTVFESTIQRLLDGYPVGFAVEYFNERYAELSTVLSDEIGEIEFGKKVDPVELAGMWTANNDARGYSIIGDPAVRLPVALANEAASQERALMVETSSTETTKADATPAAHPTAQLFVAAPVETKSGTLVSTTHPPQPIGEPTEIDYGLIDSLGETRNRLTSALQQFADRLAQTLTKTIDDAATLQVSTYVMQDMSAGIKDDFPEAARLQAYTRIKLDGDTQVVVPEESGEVNLGLWKIHLDMVERAQANRTEMIMAATSAATSLLQALKDL